MSEIEILAEGTSLYSLSQAIAGLPGGAVFDMQLQMPSMLTQREVFQIYGDLKDNNVVPDKIYQDRSNVLHIYLSKPEGVGLWQWPLLLLLGAGTLFAGFLAWRLTSTSTISTFTTSIIPLALILGGAWIAISVLGKSSK